MAKPWRCRLRLHRWQRLHNPQGGWHRECRDCGKQDDFMRALPIPLEEEEFDRLMLRAARWVATCRCSW
jgi:hypothetical protein